MYKHRIVVSAENNPYAAWQAKLLYFSCVSRLRHQPIIIVHESGSKWHSDFYDVVKAGGIVRSAPNYRPLYNIEYSPRNTAGTLLHAIDLCDAQEEFIVLCDPDMIFVREPRFPETLSGDHYTYLNYDRDEVIMAAEKLGIAQEMINVQKQEISCGVPYVIPLKSAHRLAETWLAALDAFPLVKRGDMMHAFGLAAVKLGMRIKLTYIMDHNYRPYDALKGDVIHYCYGNDNWNKRHYFTRDEAPSVWEPHIKAPKGTILGEILAQIHEARNFYDDSYFGQLKMS